ncbi:ATP-binding cassette domain-containing protein [Methylobacterium aquaticum]|uniref:ATP-binding cassette domain-containing protein n=1 Tax=Methylobacterium aquaticum TaxID=270351 RepID=UPI003D180407
MTVLLAADDLGKTYPGAGWRKAARPVLAGIDLALAEGECVALIGRSGSGKSTLARLLLGLEAADAGIVRFRGAPLVTLDRSGRRAFRAAVQMVLQDPLSAVNPRHTVGRILAEPLRHLTDLSGPEREVRIAEILRMVGLDPADAGRLPGQLSGGQVQRVGLARALATRPALVVLDEAVSNLDAPRQVDILDRLSDLRRRHGTAFLLVTHDMRLARRFADRVVVLSEGRIVDAAPCRPGGGRPALALSHPAARALLDAVLPATPQEAG